MSSAEGEEGGRGEKFGWDCDSFAEGGDACDRRDFGGFNPNTGESAAFSDVTGDFGSFGEILPFLGETEL